MSRMPTARERSLKELAPPSQCEAIGKTGAAKTRVLAHPDPIHRESSAKMLPNVEHSTFGVDDPGMAP